MLELYFLPVLAVLGIFAFVDFGGGEEEPETPGEGDDNYMQFGPEDDVSEGTIANDSMYMGIGDDFATGGAGDDRIFLSDGQDRTVDLNEDGSFDNTGMEGDDFIRGGNGRDILVDSLGSNTIHGDTGWDRMNSVDDADDQGTADTMYGGFGEDVMFADSGDVISGGGQDDRFNIIVTDNADPVTITDYQEGEDLAIRDTDGGYFITERITSAQSEDGADTNLMIDGEVVLVLQGVTEFDHASLLNPTAPAMFGARTFDEDGNVIDDDFDDTIAINEYTHSIYGFGGDDTVGFAPDAVTVGRDMFVNAGAGDDVVTLGLGDDSIVGGLGNDVLAGGGGSDEIAGGFGNDRINAVDDVITDNDEEVSSAGDLLFGGAGDDTLAFDANDAATGGEGNDTFIQYYDAGNSSFTSINDFDPRSEALIIRSSDAEGPFEFLEVAGGIGTYVTLGSAPVAFLIGVTPEQAAAADITLERV